MSSSYKPKSHFTKADWSLYYATYDQLSGERCRRGEVGDHIGDDLAAQKLVARINPGPKR